MRRQPRKVSRLSPAFAYRFALEPGDHPHDIHRRSSEQVLEVRARQATVATLAQIKAPDALREATLHARPQRILSFKRRFPQGENDQHFWVFQRSSRVLEDHGEILQPGNRLARLVESGFPQDWVVAA